MNKIFTNELSSVLAYIGLGSNLQNPVDQIKNAIEAIRNLNEVVYLACSSLYRSTPMGPQDQPDYVNAVIALSTTLKPLILLSHLQTIEQQQGRIRQNQRWSARTLDLDILLYSDQIIDLPELTVPHRGISERDFVLFPLQEIAPDLLIPGKGKIADLIKHCPSYGLERISA